MTPEELEALSRRALACEGWRWMPGMLPLMPEDGEWYAVQRLDSHMEETMRWPPQALPDISDPATLGCLLALVRKAWGDSAISTLHEGAVRDPGPWRVVSASRCVIVTMARGASEAEALVAALEAAGGE